MLDPQIIRNYALCLFNNVKSDSKHQSILEQILLFNEAISTSELLRFALYSPVVSKFDKLKLVKCLAEKFEFENILKQFFKLVIKNSRFQILPSLAKEYKQLIGKNKGIKFITVESASKPGKKVINTIREYLEKKLETNVELETIQNESLMGGVVIKYDSLLCDYSIAGAIDRAAKIAKFTKI